MLELNPSQQFSQKPLLIKGLIEEAMKLFIISKTLSTEHEDPYGNTCWGFCFAFFLSLLEAISMQPGSEKERQESETNKTKGSVVEGTLTL